MPETCRCSLTRAAVIPLIAVIGVLVWLMVKHPPYCQVQYEREVLLPAPPSQT